MELGKLIEEKDKKKKTLITRTGDVKEKEKKT